MSIPTIEQLTMSTVQVKICKINGEELYHCNSCAHGESRDYELHDHPTNSNQADMYCDGCHIFLGYDHSIEPTTHDYYMDEINEIAENIKDNPDLERIKREIKIILESN